jgi:hypothetical protein
MPEDLLQPDETDAPDGAAAAMPPRDARPAEVPEKFWDPQRREIRVDALLKSYLELERRLSRRAGPPAPDSPAEEVARWRASMGVPETPEAYEIRAPHELCCADAAVNGRLHEANFTNTQAQLVYDLAAERLLPLIAEAAAEFEADRQRQKLAEHFGGEERYRKAAGQLLAWGRANLAPAVLEALSTTAEGVLAIEQMMKSGAEPALPRDGGHAAPEPESEAELRAMMRDPRYWRTREPEFVRRVTEGFRRLVNG